MTPERTEDRAIRAGNGWPSCLNWPALGCLCRGAMQNGGSFCARKRERDQARKEHRND